MRAYTGTPARSQSLIVQQVATAINAGKCASFSLEYVKDYICKRQAQIKSPFLVLIAEKMPITALPQRSPVACALHSTASSGVPRVLTHRGNGRGPHKRAFAGKMCAAPAVSTEVAEDTYTWTGEDEFDRLNDRIDAPPLPLPSIKEARRVALVRHGQSTWNAQGRVQGSSNLSYLTKKGESQAETTRELVSHPHFVSHCHGCTASCTFAHQTLAGSVSTSTA